MTFKTLFSLMTMWLLSSLYPTVHAQTDESIRKKHFNTEKQLAIGGYDPVPILQLKRPSKAPRKIPLPMEGLLIIFHPKKRWTLLKKTLPGTSLRTVAGVPMLWGRAAKK